MIKRQSNTHLATVYVLHCTFSEQKVHIGIGLKRPDELGLVQPLGIVVLCPQIRSSQVPDDGRVCARKVHRATGKVLAVERDHGRDVGKRTVRTLAHPAHGVGHAVGIFHLSRHRNVAQLVRVRSLKRAISPVAFPARERRHTFAVLADIDVL